MAVLAQRFPPEAGRLPGREFSKVLLFALSTLSIALPVGWKIGRIFDQADASFYIGLAEGREAMLPFASRQLGPLLVRAIVALGHLSTHKAFLIEGLAAMLFFVVSVGVMLSAARAQPWLLAGVAGLLFWSTQFNALAMPDLVYAALLCGFLLLLSSQRFLAAALMLFPLMISRESTLLTLLCFLAAGWRRLRWPEVTGALLATGAGTAVVKRLTAHALPNVEHISPALYLVAKMPWNLAKNVFGMELWANVYPACEAPVSRTAVHLGPLHELGWCGFVPSYPEWTACFLLGSFGLLPLVLWRVRRVRPVLAGRGAIALRFALLYGLLSFTLAPLLGVSLVRLFGYSWPLFFLALPFLLRAGKARFRSTGTAVAFTALHLGVSWCFYLTRPERILTACLLGWALGWWILRSGLEVELPDASAPLLA